eukprot:Sspe_Gene.112632::Locus_95741_Transcript_1_1_Confidence_1.000_Length_703::g.112632::m.112632
MRLSLQCRWLSVGEAWSVLRIPPGSSLEAVKAKHRQLALGLHPDTGRGDEEAMKRVNEAYGVLRSALAASGRGRTSKAPQRAAPTPTRRHPTTAAPRSTVSAGTQVHIHPERAGSTVNPGLRDLRSMLRSMKQGGDPFGPKYQAADPRHWGKAYGRNSTEATPDEEEGATSPRREQMEEG